MTNFAIKIDLEVSIDLEATFQGIAYGVEKGVQDTVKGIQIGWDAAGRALVSGDATSGLANMIRSTKQVMDFSGIVDPTMEALNQTAVVFADVLKVKSWIPKVSSLISGEAANKNRINMFGDTWPNMLKVASTVVSCVADFFYQLQFLEMMGFIAKGTGEAIVYAMTGMAGKQFMNVSGLLGFSIDLLDCIRIANEKNGLSLDVLLTGIGDVAKITAIGVAMAAMPELVLLGIIAGTTAAIAQFAKYAVKEYNLNTRIW